MPTTKTPSSPPLASAPSSDQSPISEERPRSLPPPPPSARPAHQRPASIIPSPLPPPASARLPVPSAPPAPTFAPTPVGEEVERLESELSSLRKRLATQRHETKVEQKNNELLRNEIAILKTKLGKQSSPSEAELEQLRVKKQFELERRDYRQQAEAKEALLNAQLSEVRGEFESTCQRLAEELEGLRTELKLTEQSNQTHQLKELQRELETLQRSNTALEHRLTSLSRERDSLQEKVDTQPLAPTAPAADDLTRIKGIGPSFAKALSTAGVTSFAAIAAWTEEDMETIAAQIKTTPARIKKNDWVQAARTFCAEVG